MNVLQKARQLADEVAKRPDDPKLADSWALVGRLLSRPPLAKAVDQAALADAIEDRDAAALDAIIRKVEQPEVAAPAAAASPADDPEVSHDEMQRALKAFRKRLKLSRLDEESKLGGRQLTGGRSSQIVAIIPPNDFPPHVWRALEREGRLKHSGKGFYEEA